MGSRGDLIDFGPALEVADAALYRARLSGVLAPRGWADVQRRGPSPSWWNRTQCLIQGGPGTQVEVRLRFLDPMFRSVRAAETRFALAELLDDVRAVTVASPGSAARGRMVVHAEPVTAVCPLHKVSVRVENAVPGVSSCLPRQHVLRLSLISAQLLLGAAGGSFLSLLEPPRWTRRAASSCRNVRMFPVLAGPYGTTRLMLSAPVMLCDHPQAASYPFEVAARGAVMWDRMRIGVPLRPGELAVDRCHRGDR